VVAAGRDVSATAGLLEVLLDALRAQNKHPNVEWPDLIALTVEWIRFGVCSESAWCGFLPTLDKNY
jgi:hypothetical protein